MSHPIATTERLALRELDVGDAPFIVRLVNEPGWLRYIGDRGIRTIEAAQRYIVEGPADMYARLGFGLYLVSLQASGEPIGICGLIKRDSLEDVDLGFALLQDHWGRGYAHEAARAVMAQARALGLPRVVAILSRDNERSARVLERLDFRFAREVAQPHAEQPVLLYSSTLSTE